MKKPSLAIMAFLGIAIIHSVAFAHHGKKYLVTGSHELPKVGSWHFLLSTDYGSAHGERTIGLEPGFLFGLTRRISLEVHAHHGFEEGAFHTEAVAAEVRVGILGNVSEHGHHGETEGSSFGLAVLGEFEKGLGHHGDSMEGRVIFGGDVSSFSLAANFIWQQPLRSSESHEIGYALGVKHELLSFVGIGAEVRGAFDGSRTPEFTPGFYFSPVEKFDVKVGATLRSHSEGGVVRLAVVYGL